MRRALAQRQPTVGLLHHSNRGTYHTGEDCQAALAAAEQTVSMSRLGDCWDNAVVESFCATHKTELVHDARWATQAETTAALAAYIDRAGTIGGAGTRRSTT